MDLALPFWTVEVAYRGGDGRGAYSAHRVPAATPAGAVAGALLELAPAQRQSLYFIAVCRSE